MDNFTPLSSNKKKKKINRFLLISNILMIFVIGITGYYLQSRMFTYNSMAIPKSKANGNTPRVAAKRQWEQAVRKAYENEYSDNSDFDIAKIGTQEYLDKFPPPSCNKGDPGCVASGVGGVNENHYSVCTNGSANYYCNDSGGGGGGGENEKSTIIASVPTDIPILTSTSAPIEIPTSTPTPTIVPTLPEELTPTDILFEITPTLSPTPTNTPTVTSTPAPGTPTATPTEIILAKISVSPTAVAKLLETGMVKSFIYLIPAAIMLIGLIL